MPELPRKGALRFRMHACTKMPEMRQDRAQDRRVHKRHRASSMQNLRPKGPHCFGLPPKEAAERQTRPAFQRRRSGARRWNRAAVSSTTCRGHGDGVFTESKQTRALSKESRTYVKDTRTSQEAERMSTFQRRRSGARRWHSAAVSSTTWQLLDLSCQSTRTMWSRRTSSSVMKTIATSGVMEAIALRHRRFSARGRGRGPRGNFCANKKRMYDQDGQAERSDPADC